MEIVHSVNQPGQTGLPFQFIDDVLLAFDRAEVPKHVCFVIFLIAAGVVELPTIPRNAAAPVTVVH